MSPSNVKKNAKQHFFTIGYFGSGQKNRPSWIWRVKKYEILMDHQSVSLAQTQEEMAAFWSAWIIFEKKTRKHFRV